MRVRRSILIIATVATSWLGMQLVHELGHVIGAYSTGGSVARIVFHPLELSRTDLGRNPRPLVVVWAGPIAGTVLPLAAWAIAAFVRVPLCYLARFFAGFCLVANGAYIGVGAFGGVGDSTAMLLHGSAVWAMVLFAAATIPLGLWLWHRQGRHFGIGGDGREVDMVATIVASVACAILVTLGCTLGHG